MARPDRELAARNESAPSVVSRCAASAARSHAVRFRGLSTEASIAIAIVRFCSAAQVVAEAVAQC
jgi:hypothetical protein